MVMEHSLIADIITVFAALIAHFLGIRIGGTAALRAASADLGSKAKFPWAEVIRAFLGFLISLTKTPGIFKKEKAPSNGDNRQN
jgi:hypothetical protein